MKVQEIQTEEIKKSQRIGVVFNCNKKNFPYFSIDVITGEANEEVDGFVGKAEKLDISRYVDTDELCDGDKQLLASLRKLQETEINKYISRNSPFSGIWENIIQQEGDDLPEETKELIAEYLFPKLKKLFADASGNALTYILPAKKTFKTNNLESLQLSAEEARPHFIVRKNSHYSIQCRVKAGGMEYDLGENEINSPLFFSYNNQLYLWKNNEVVHLVEKFLPEGKMNIPHEDWNKTLYQFILPLAREHKVDFDKSIVQEVKEGDPEVKLFLMEKGDYLVFQPSFSYKGYETRIKDRDDVVVPQGEKVIIVHRNREAENNFIRKLQNLHSNFIYNDETGFAGIAGN